MSIELDECLLYAGEIAWAGGEHRLSEKHASEQQYRGRIWTEKQHSSANPFSSRWTSTFRLHMAHVTNR